MPGKGTYSAGTAYITIVPSFKNIEDAFKQQVREMAAAADKDLSSALARGLKDAGREAKGAGEKAGKDYGSAYENGVKKHLNAAWRGLPAPDPDVKLTKWEKALAGVRSDMKELAGQRIGIDIDKPTFDKAVDDARKKLTELRTFAAGPNRERNFFNADAALGNLDDLQKFTRDAERRAGEGGDQAGSAFNQRMAKVLESGMSKLPPMKIKADSTEAEVKLAKLQERMQALASKRIGVNIDAGEAYAELKAINFELGRLDRKKVQVDVRTNAHEAGAEMGAFVKEAEAAGEATGGIGGRADLSLSRLELLIAAGASLGSTIVPAAVAAAGAIGFLGTAALGALSGVGVLALGLSGVTTAVQALNKYSQDQAKSSNSVNQANRRMAGTTDQVRMAQLSLGNTRRQIAQGEQDSAKKIAAAERDVSAARHQGRIDLADASRQVKDAQRDVTDAERDAVDTRRSLNDAIEAATRDQEELSLALEHNSIDQRQAITAQMDALEKLNAVQVNPRSSEVELRKAQDAYDETTVKIKELAQKQKELSQDKAKADKLGVEGDNRVIEARRRVADADEKVVKAREKVAVEVAQRRDVEYKTAAKIADAQRKVGDAQLDAARKQKDGQYQLAQAQNSVTSAIRSQQQAYEKVDIAGGAALSNLDTAMGQLTPTGQRFARFIFGLKDEFLRLRAAASDPLLPDLQDAITALLPYMPALERFIGKVAAGLGDIARRVAASFGNPTWQRFFHFVDQTAVPSLSQLYTITENFTEGLISLFLALTPFNGQVGGGLVKMSQDFALWADRLNKTKGYREFLDYVRENGPKVVHFLGELGELAIDLVKALMPVGSTVISILTPILDFVNSFPPGVLTGLVYGIAAVSATLLGLSAIMRAKKIKDDLDDIFGPKRVSMVQTYAYDTGRATAETGKFKTATATAAGIAEATRNRVAGLGAAVQGLGGKLQAATTGAGPLGKTLDQVRTAALGAAAAMNGPDGMIGAVQAGVDKLAGLAAGGEVAASHGLGKVKEAAMEVALATNGPGGLAAGAQVAAGKVGGLARSAGNAAVALGRKMRAGVGSVVTMLGGPWAAALAAATIAVGVFTDASASWKSDVNGLSDALGELGDKYRELAAAGKLGTREAADQIGELVGHNPQLQQAAIFLGNMGVSLDQLGAAAAGNKPQLDAMMNVLDQQIGVLEAKWRSQTGLFGFKEWTKDARTTSDQLANLRKLREATKDQAEKAKLAAQAQALVNEQDQRNADITQIQAKFQARGNAAVQQAIGLYDGYQTKIDHANNFLTAFTSATATATDRAKALNDMIDDQTGGMKAATDAADDYQSKLLDLRDAIKSNGSSMNEHTRAGQANRTAIKQAAEAAKELYVQDIASGMPMKEATRLHKLRIDALLKETDQGNLNRQAVTLLVNEYGQVPKKIITDLETQNFKNVYNQLVTARFMQEMLREGKSADEAAAAWKDQQRVIRKAQQVAKGNWSGVGGLATGGPVVGPGTGTSDSVLIRASNDEHMITAKEVQAAGGHDVIYAWRKYLLDGGQLPGYRHGGEIRKEGLPAYAKGGPVTWPFMIDLKKTLIPDPDMGFALGGGRGGGQGYKWQMAVLHQVFPKLHLLSGPRPGAHTISGGLSWHARPNKEGVIGRAVDVDPIRAVANWIAAHYGKDTKELITPWPELGIWQGKPHHFSDAVQAQHDGRTSVRHVHWAFDDGGWLMPGAQQIVNATGKPEAVLNPGQWQTIEEFVNQGMTRGGDGATYNIEFADTTLTPAHLRSMQQREDVLARAGRPR